jgi:exonuclease V gamma subunit
VRHLALCLSLGEDTKASSSLVMQDGTLSLQPVTPEVAADHLQQLIELWQRGQQEPLPFFPEAAQVYAQSMGKDGLAEQALDKAEKAWEKDEYGTGPATQSVASLFQGQNPIRASDFAELALRVFEPILEYSAKPEN